MSGHQELPYGRPPWSPGPGLAENLLPPDWGRSGKSSYVASQVVSVYDPNGSDPGTQIAPYSGPVWQGYAVYRTEPSASFTGAIAQNTSSPVWIFDASGAKTLPNGANFSAIPWGVATVDGTEQALYVIQSSQTIMRFYNADIYTAPAHACMQIVGDTVIDGVVYISIMRPAGMISSGTVYTGYPSPDIMRAEYVFNLCGDVAPGDTGVCEFASSSADFPTLALFSSSDPSPQVLDVWGPAGGDWILRQGMPGYKVLGIGVDETDEGGCQASTSDPVIRIIESHEIAAPFMFYGLNSGSETQVPPFSGLSLGTYGDPGGDYILNLAYSAGWIASAAGQGTVGTKGTDPCFGAWGIISGPQAGSGDTGALNRSLSDGFTSPIPVRVTGIAAFQPIYGGLCGPIPTVSTSDPNRFCFGAGLPGWRCVSAIWSQGSGSSTVYGCFVVRDHLTTSFPAVANTNWNVYSGSTPTSSSIGYVTCFAITGGAYADSSGGSVYNGVGTNPLVQLNVATPGIGMQDPNILIGNFLEYTIGAGFMGNPLSGGLYFTENHLFWESTQVPTDAGVARCATPYLDDKFGTIKMWLSNLTAPQGWHVCDGTNGTIDLRGRLVGMQGNVAGNGANQALPTGGAFNGTLNVVVDSTSHNCTLTETAGPAAPASNQFYAYPPCAGVNFIQRVK